MRMVLRRTAEVAPRPAIETELRVRYAETDAMGIAHHTSYFVWFEVGRTEYTRAVGLPYRDVERDGVRLVVVEACCRFHHAARYDDLVVIRTTVPEVTRATLTFAYEVRQKLENTLLADGHTVHAATDLHGRVQRIPDNVRGALTGGEGTSLPASKKR